MKLSTAERVQTYSAVKTRFYAATETLGRVVSLTPVGVVILLDSDMFRDG
jgi:hypothetical protein